MEIQFLKKTPTRSECSKLASTVKADSTHAAARFSHPFSKSVVALLVFFEHCQRRRTFFWSNLFASTGRDRSNPQPRNPQQSSD